MKKRLLVCFSFFASLSLQAQFYQQYFDGEDTLVDYSLFLQNDTSSSDLWQVGPPQKVIFDSPSTVPNVLVTDTLNYYPDSANTYVWFEVPADVFNWGHGVAIQWNQKLDLDTNKDGGLVEFSVDSGNTWLNGFTDPLVYEFYGYNAANEGTTFNGEPCFTGTDTIWAGVWFCFGMAFGESHDNLRIRFRIVTDSIQTNQEGWMIDNLLAQPTFFHPVAEHSRNKNLKIYPTIADQQITVEIISPEPDYSVKQITVVNSTGQIIWQGLPLANLTQLNTGTFAPGKYWLRIETSVGIEMHEFIVAR